HQPGLVRPELQLVLDLLLRRHTVPGTVSSTISSTASRSTTGSASTISPAWRRRRNGYQMVNATSEVLIGQPATVSAIRYSSSGSVANSHNRTTPRSPCP